LKTKLTNIFIDEQLSSTSVKAPIQILPNWEEPKLSRIRCNFCYEFFEDSKIVHQPGSHLRTELTTEQGLLVSRGDESLWKANHRKIIKAHLRSQIHIDAINVMKEATGHKVKSNLQKVVLECPSFGSSLDINRKCIQICNTVFSVKHTDAKLAKIA